MRPLRERIKGVARVFNHPKAGLGAPRMARKGVQIIAFQQAMKKMQIVDPKIRKKVFKAVSEYDKMIQAQYKLESVKGMFEATSKLDTELTKLIGKENATRLLKESELSGRGVLAKINEEIFG